MASLWIWSGLGWPLKGFVPQLSTFLVGAHFEALHEGVLMAVNTIDIEVQMLTAISQMNYHDSTLTLRFKNIDIGNYIDS